MNGSVFLDQVISSGAEKAELLISLLVSNAVDLVAADPRTHDMPNRRFGMTPACPI